MIGAWSDFDYDRWEDVEVTVGLASHQELMEIALKLHNQLQALQLRMEVEASYHPANSPDECKFISITWTYDDVDYNNKILGAACETGH